MLAYDSTDSERNSEHSDSACFDTGYFASVTSDESEISATQLATHIDYGVIWEILNGCQDAAFADVPSKCHQGLSIFNIKNSCDEERFLTENSVNDDEGYDALFEVAGATKTTLEPWALPNPMRPLSDEDVIWRQNVRVLEVSQVHPTAAIYLALNHAATALETFDSNMSPLVHATAPRFASAVFTAASHIFPHCKNISLPSMRRYSRLATTSLLRQARALHIDMPVFGILLRGNLVAIHVDWYEEHDGVVEFFSAFYPLDDEESDIKTWDLKHPREKQEIVTILSNLRKYTHGPFASQVRRESGSIGNPIKPWKWNASCLFKTLSPAQLRQRSEEPSGDKINRWRKSLDTDQGTSKTWLKGKLASRPPQLVDQGKDFLSPPSTPGDG